MKYLLSIIVVLFFSPISGFSQQNQETKKMNKALIIIDIQNDYFDGAMPLTGPVEASLNARQILDKFRADGLPIVHIQHISIRAAATPLKGQTRGAQIHENVKPADNEKVIIKHFPNGFKETELLEYLKGKDITDLVVCGMMTHMCVDATVRAAKDFGFNCAVIGDACATRDLMINGETIKAADVHKSFLAAFSGYYALIMTTKQYLEGK